MKLKLDNTSNFRNKNSVTYFGDSFMGFSINKTKYSWVDKSINELRKSRHNVIFYKKIINRITSRGILDELPNFFVKIKKKDILVIQIGVNDSRHFLSLKGLPNTDLKSYSKNLIEIYKKSLVYGFKEIIFVSYHKINNKKIEGNKKSFIQNLNKYKKLLKNFCKKRKLYLIEIDNKYRNFCLNDKIHLNKIGTDHYSKKVNKIIRKILNEKKT